MRTIGLTFDKEKPKSKNNKQEIPEVIEQVEETSKEVEETKLEKQQEIPEVVKGK